jgi:hypothetical protein
MRVKQDESIWDIVAAMMGLIIYLLAFVMMETYPPPELAPGESLEELATELEDYATLTRAFGYLGLIGFLVFGGSVIVASFRTRRRANDQARFCRLVHPDKHGPR